MKTGITSTLQKELFQNEDRNHTTTVSIDRNHVITPNDVILGDCMELLPFIESESVHLIAIDPPYEIQYNNEGWDKSGSVNWNELTAHFHRILKPSGSVLMFQGWSNVAQTTGIVGAQFALKNWIIYDRIKGRGAQTDLVSTREDILWFVKNEKNYIFNKVPSSIRKKTGGTIGKKNGCAYRALSNVWTDISPIVPWSKERVDHPTQKPLQLMDRIIQVFSNEGDVVLDCFAGSGSSIVSAQNNKRKYIGIEKEQKYYDIMLRRLGVT